MTINRVSAINAKRKLLPVLWVQLKTVYSTSWFRLVLIREKKQKLIIFIYTLASSATGFPVHPQPAGRQNWNIISIIFDFLTGNVLFFDEISFSESSSLYWLPFPKDCSWEVLKSVWMFSFMVKSLTDTEYFFIDFRLSMAWIIIYWTLKNPVCRIFLSQTKTIFRYSKNFR